MTTFFHKCGGEVHAHDASLSSAAHALKFNAPKTSRPLTIDMHCHIVTPAVERLITDTSQKKGEREYMVRTMGEASTAHNQQMFAGMAARLADVDTRLGEMDAMGVDVQVVSASPGQYYYWAELEMATEIVRLQNERIAEVCAQHPTRFLGLGAVAMQHPDLAVAQMEHAVHQLGMKGVEVSTSINGVDLSDGRYDKFWATVEALNVVVFIHPLGTSLGERVNMHYLSNIIGQPLETTIALSKLIFDGVLDRYPTLKLLAAHGGGYLPGYIGRTDHGNKVRPEAGGLHHKPSDYLKRIYYDNLVFTPQQIKVLIDQVGVSQVVVGTDYPFDMGQYDVHDIVNAIEGLSDPEREQILSGNAMRLLGIG